MTTETQEPKCPCWGVGESYGESHLGETGPQPPPSDPPHPHLLPDTGKPQEGNSFPGRAVGAGTARVRSGAGVTRGHRRVDTDMCLFDSLLGHGGFPVREVEGREADSSLTSKHPAECSPPILRPEQPKVTTPDRIPTVQAAP